MNTKKITSFLLLFVVCFSIIPFTGILAKENTTDSNKSTRKEQNCIPGHVDINCGAVIVSFID